MKCPNCGTESEMVAEENVVNVKDHNVIFANRQFRCPKCNKIFSGSIGHHGTLSVKKLKMKFPKGKLRKCRAALPEAERKDFKATLDGKRMPKDGEIDRWLVDGGHRKPDAGAASLFLNDVPKVSDKQRIRMAQVCQNGRSGSTKTREHLGIAVPG